MFTRYVYTKLVRDGTYSKGERLTVKYLSLYIGYKSACMRYVPDSYTKVADFEVGQLHGVPDRPLLPW